MKVELEVGPLWEFGFECEAPQVEYVRSQLPKVGEALSNKGLDSLQSCVDWLCSKWAEIRRSSVSVTVLGART